MTIKLNNQILIILTDFNSVKIIKTEEREERKLRVFQSYLLPQFRKFEASIYKFDNLSKNHLNQPKFHPSSIPLNHRSAVRSLYPDKIRCLIGMAKWEIA